MKTVPCVGCGMVHEGYGRPRWTKANPLCFDCRRILKDKYPRLVAEEKAAKDIGFVEHSCDRIDAGQAQMHYTESKEWYRFTNSIVAFLNTFPRAEYPNSGYEDRVLGGCRSYAKMPKNQAEALKVIFREIAAYTKLCYADGKEAGADMLTRLATGDVSVRDFNKWCARKEER